MTALRKPTADEGDITEAIVSAIDALTVMELDALGAWQDLAELSTRTEFEAIGTDEASVVLENDRFEAIANIYVLLNYGLGEDEESLSDSYMATVHGIMESGVARITEVDVDTSSFYS